MRPTARSAVLLLAAALLPACGNREEVAPNRAEVSAAESEAKIAFSSSRDGDFEVYVMNPDGSGVHQLTHNEESDNTDAKDDGPAWSPDGRRIAFTSTRDHPSGGSETDEIYVMNADGSDQRRLTNNGSPDLAPRWTSRSEITFTSCREGLSDCDLVTVNADGGGQTSVDVEEDLVFGYAVSPDGSKVAFTHAEGGIAGVFEGRNTDVYVMDIDGGNRTRLTESKARDRGAAWSPDGKRLVFTSDRDKNGPCLWHDCVGHNPEIYVMAADGSHERRLTNDPGEDGLPEWSPDGTRLLFSAFRDGSDYELYVMNADGTCVTQLTRNSEWDWSPDWFWPEEPKATERLRC